MRQKAGTKDRFIGITMVACSMMIVGALLQVGPAGAGEVIEVNAGPGIQWVSAQGQAGTLPFQVKIKVKVGDILVFNQASEGIPHGLRIDNTASIRQCHQSAADKPDAVLAEVPPCPNQALSNLAKQIPGLQPNEQPKPFILLRVIKEFSGTTDFRCHVHNGDGQMQGQLFMQ